MTEKKVSATTDEHLTKDLDQPEDVQDIVEVQELEEIAKRIVKISSTMIRIDQEDYRLLSDFREAFDLEKINERYSDILKKYDFIVGDIGFEQLRLKGFYEDHRKRVAIDQKISTLKDYLYEFCNFGCAYFVLEKVNKPKELQEKKEAFIKEKKGYSKNPRQQANKQQPFKNQPKGKPASNNKGRQPAKKTPSKNKNQVGQQTNTSQPRNFTIRKKEQD